MELNNKLSKYIQDQFSNSLKIPIEIVDKVAYHMNEKLTQPLQWEDMELDDALYKGAIIEDDDSI